MMRQVDYRQAVLAGMAGAAAWELAARPLLWVGVPVLDIVHLLADVAVPDADWPVWWLAGMAGALMGVVWNYAMSGLFVWRKK